LLRPRTSFGILGLRSAEGRHHSESEGPCQAKVWRGFLFFGQVPPMFGSLPCWFCCVFDPKREQGNGASWGELELEHQPADPMSSTKNKNFQSLTLPPNPAFRRLTVKIPEAAAMLGVSSSSIRRAIDRGDIRVNRKLRHVLIPLSEIERFAAV